MNPKLSRLPARLTAYAGALLLSAAAMAMDLGTNFWNLKWHAQDDCFLNVRSVAGEAIWNPRFLEEIKPFQSLRFMDWDATNKSPRKSWSERKLPDNPDQTVVAYEWMIDLCNRNQSDLWICIPHQTIDRNQGDHPSDYALRLAILIRHGIDMGTVDLVPVMDRLAELSADDLLALGGKRTSLGLDRNLRIYFEYSNETWNGMFQQTHYALKEGTALQLNPEPKLNDKGEDWANCYRFHAWAALRVFRAADLVFGDKEPRVEKVLATHIGNSFATRQHLAVLADPKLNPWGVRATAIAPAPYFGHKVKGNSPEVVAELRADIKRVGERSARYLEIAKEAGLKLIAYEGGQHVTTKADAINREPVMYELYREYLAEMAKHYEHFSHYCHVGKAGGGGAWGALERTGQPIEEAHKYRALVHYTAENPRKPLAR